MDYTGNIIAGEAVETPERFTNDPVAGSGVEAMRFPVGTPDLVDRACNAAADAFESYSRTSRADRAAFLRACADAIDAAGEDITRVGSAETGLPEGRLQGERGRTVGQLRLFADHIEKGDGPGGYLDVRHDAADPDRQPLPKPDLRLMQRAIGPVAVFGASNFPLAFSVALDVPVTRVHGPYRSRHPA